MEVTGVRLVVVGAPIVVVLLLLGNVHYTKQSMHQELKVGKAVLPCSPATCRQGRCEHGQCVCKQGFGGAQCNRCAAGYTNYPRCRLDETCYAVVYSACAANQVLVLRNKGMLPGRPRRDVKMELVTDPPSFSPMDVFAVRIEPGQWGTDTVSLRACSVLMCESQRENKTRPCSWVRGVTDKIQVFLRASGCQVDIARRPPVTPYGGAGFKGECKEDDKSLACTQPSRRHSSFLRDVSWYMTRTESRVQLQSAVFHNHFLTVQGAVPTLQHGMPDDALGVVQLVPLGSPYTLQCSQP